MCIHVYFGWEGYIKFESVAKLTPRKLHGPFFLGSVLYTAN